MRPEVVFLVIVAAVGFAGWWFERRRGNRLFSDCKGLELERQGLTDAARFVLTVVREAPEGHEAGLTTFINLARALQAELKAKWRCLRYQQLGTDTQEMSDRWETATMQVERRKDEMRQELSAFGS